MTSATAWSAAAALLSIMCALATVSGGHFNPAVTLAVTLSGRGKCLARDGRYYVLAQFLAAVVAGLFLNYVHTHGPTSKETFGLLLEHGSHAWFQSCIVEVLFTFVLAYVVLTVATSEAHTSSWPSFYFAFAIAFTVAGAAYAAGRISGGYLNPAVVLGLAIEGEPSFSSHATVKSWPAFLDTIMRIFSVVFQFIEYYLTCLLYWIPQIIGALSAAGTFRVVYSGEYKHKMVH